MPHTDVPFRIGLGYDSHRLGSGGPLRLAGINVPADVHAIGHSDADVVLHALTDALLGALAQPDIGRLFPDTASENKDRDSQDFLSEARSRVVQSGYHIANLDVVILAQKPKLSDYMETMRGQLADSLSLQLDQVGIKAKTGEKVDAIGRGEAIASRVVIMLYR
ncbi:MAG: 2-C-methyl-D-erythritol 2,4-cyclodiphosphate synthase [Planctomycetota bacterium]